jgi:hypothetical protein
MKKYTIEELKAEYKRLNYKWFDFHFVAVRSKANEKDKFDDLFGVISGDKIKWFSCTTNPGTHWLKNLLNPKGAALVVPNQYIDSWKLGLHQGKYEAFVQAKPITVYRDKNLNDIAEEGAITETGMFGINIHRANEKAISQIIDKWSAGCTVLNNPADFKVVHDDGKATKLAFFTYTILKEF